MTSRRRRPGAFELQTLVLAAMLGMGSASAAVGPTGSTSPSGQTHVPDRVTAGVPAKTTSLAILGSAWNSDNTPIPFARLRLRNLVTARIDGATIANEVGEFEFRGVEAGSYLIELVSEHGNVLAVGHTFTMDPGETIATFVRLGSKAPWFTGFFGNAALAVATAAAAAGLTAVAPEQVRPVSNRQ